MNKKKSIDKLFYLETSEDKIKLIELLLIIASLIVAFKISGTFYTLFIVFVFCSIPYFIMIHKADFNKKEKELINIISFVIAITFSAIISVVLALSAINDLPNPLMKVISYFLIVIPYLLISTLIIGTALKVK